MYEGETRGIIGPIASRSGQRRSSNREQLATKDICRLDAREIQQPISKLTMHDAIDVQAELFVEVVMHEVGIE